MNMKIRGIAHRGDPRRAPENTLSAFQAACSASYSHLELDVQLSKDGVPVVFHDYTINRLCDGTGYLRDYTVNELKQFRVKETETIPTLEETLSMFKGKINFMIELKQMGDLYPTLEEAVLDVVHQTNTYVQSCLLSFDHFSLIKLRELDPDIELQVLTSHNMPYIFPFLKEIRCNYLNVPYKFLTPKYAEMIHAHGATMNLTIVDTIEDMKTIADKYPSALITTNELDRWAEVYRSHPELQLVSE
jgi:glycerophosphoryl diester phosphodiesterase